MGCPGRIREGSSSPWRRVSESSQFREVKKEEEQFQCGKKKDGEERELRKII